jgi:hypothetical protein
MAQSLTITKQTGNFFTLDLVVDAFAYPQVISDKNRMLTQGTLCDFKTANGANLIKKQNIDVTEITVIASGTFTFVSTFALWNKLKDVGFFDGLSSGGSASVIDRFDELLDTFPYVSNNGYVPVVDVSQQKLVATPFYNYRTFLELEDVLATALVANKIVAVDSLGTGLILIDAPATPETYLNAVGSFHYNDLATITTPLTIVATVPKKLTNDTDGANTILTNAPYGVSNVWDDANNEFDFSDLSVGDLVTIRIDVDFTTTGANQNYSLYGNFGIGSAKAFTLIADAGIIKTVGTNQIVGTIELDIAYSEIKNNPAQIFLLSDNGGTLKVNGWFVDILRKNINIVDVSTSVNLSATQSPTNVTVVNSGGDDAVLPSANNTNAGILLPSDYNKIQSAQQVNQKDVSNGYVGLSGFRIRMLNTLGTIDSYLRNSATVTREWIFPDKNGTVAMTSDIANKQDTLISNVNIKTINGNTLLGSGNLVISGGGGDLNPYVKAISVFDSESYGDSITVGQGSTSGNSYIELISDFYSLSNINRAVSARGIWETIRLHNLNIDPTNIKTSIVMSGFNDVRRGGNAFKTISKIKNGYRALIANQFLKTFIPAHTSPSITTSGSWSTYPADTVGGKSSASKGLGSYSLTIGDYKTYTFKDDNVVLAMIGSDGVYETHGNFDVHIDGVFIGNFTGNNKTDGISDGSNSNTRSPYILYFGGLTNAMHTITVTLTSANSVVIDYFGNLLNPKFCAPLFICEAPKMNATGYATSPALATDAIIDELNLEINNVVNEFNLDYPIIVSKTNDFYDVATGLSGDNIHPNDIGYRQIFSSIVSASEYLLPIRNLGGFDLAANNVFTGLNKFTKELKISEGIQIKGSFPANDLVGEGIELEYYSNIGYLSSYDRTGLIYKPLIARAETFSINTFSGTGGGLGITKFKILENGNVIIQSGGTFTDNGALLQVNGTAIIKGLLGLRNVADTFTSFFTNTNTASRTYTLQNRNGILADDTDLATKINSRIIINTSGSATMGAAALTDYVYLVTGAHTMTLPTAVGNTNRYTVNNSHTANITVNTTSSQTINGSLTISLIPDQSVDIISNGTNWRLI